MPHDLMESISEYQCDAEGQKGKTVNRVPRIEIIFQGYLNKIVQIGILLILTDDSETTEQLTFEC